jgi:hypothetical protein
VSVLAAKYAILWHRCAPLPYRRERVSELSATDALRVAAGDDW